MAKSGPSVPVPTIGGCENPVMLRLFSRRRARPAGVLALVLAAALFSSPAGAAPNQAPLGHIDRFRQAPGSNIEITGWALDLDTSLPVTLHIYVNNALAATTVANVARPNLATVYPGYTNAGFSTLVPVTAATNRVCVYAINRPAGTNVGLGCATFSQNPVGHLDSVVRYPGGNATSVRAKGWALDPDTAGGVAIHFYVDGSLAGSGTANTARPGLDALYPGYTDNHGFLIDVLVPAGTHSICAFVIDTGPGANRQLGCSTITITTLPFGALDSVTRSGGNVRVKGWSIDPDATTPVAVEVLATGVPIGTASAGNSRPDLGLYIPVYGANHGFDTTLPLPGGGAWTVCVYARNLGLGSGSRLLGCRSV